MTFPVRTLGEIADQERGGLVDGPFGSNLPASDYQPTGVPVLRGSNLSLGPAHLNESEFVFVSEATATRLSRSICRRGDIVFTKKGTLGQTGYISSSSQFEKYLLSSNQMKLSVNREVAVPEFVYYYVSAPSSISKIIQEAEATGVPKTNVAYLKTFPIMLPELPVQEAIVEALSSLDDKIELNRRMNETLEKMARSLFRDWFVDFGPTRRQMDGATDPADIMGQALLAEKAATLAPLFPAKRGDNGLPEGWETISFGDALADAIGGDWGKENPDDKYTTEVAIVRGTDFGALQEGMKGKVPQRFTTGKKAERRTLQPGDILLEVSGGSPTQPTGRSLWVSKAMLDRFECDVVPASFCRRFRPKDAAWSLVLRQHLNDLYLRGGTWEYQNQSTGISNFQTTHFLEAEQVIHPSEAVLAAFHEVVGPLIQKTATNENQTLAEMRDLLLPKLMSGEIRLKDAEAAV